ncbi:hypothetical protein BaRGS_00026030 [Batillaria attramentaria]|uniref:Uncharacterized protein n=1 Tax=Batillaria attramentaria TaxID=370345 RepID=A0ABD0K799_9CAEN
MIVRAALILYDCQAPEDGERAGNSGEAAFSWINTQKDFSVEQITDDFDIQGSLSNFVAMILKGVTSYLP